MNDGKLELYWAELPTGKENAATYGKLCDLWNMSPRMVRKTLHKLSVYDNGDDLILIRSASGRGFYKTDNAAEIEAYRRECLNRGRNVFAPLRKINRVQAAQDAIQYSVENNLRVVRLACGLQQKEVCERMREFDAAFDVPMLSRMENGACLPTPAQLAKLAQIYAVQPADLVRGEMFALSYFDAKNTLASARKGVC